MSDFWWKDLLDRNNHWQGLELVVRENDEAKTMSMLSGHPMRMALQIRGETLFWATVLKDHTGVWLVFNADHSNQKNLLPPVTSQEVESVCRRDNEDDRLREWCRYFARQLMAPSSSLLPSRRWLIRPMTQVKQTPRTLKKLFTVENSYFRTPVSTSNMGCDWQLYASDIPDLTQLEKVQFVDWWDGGGLLLGRYPVDTDASRLKWWRKKSREGTCPPILVWYVSGLASYVILDGHYRFQAAKEEGIPPKFLVLSELREQIWTPDPEHQARILRAIEHQQRKNPNINIDSMNHMLINLYDNHYLYSSTTSRAVPAYSERWTQEVSTYLRRHQLEDYQERILNRIE